MTSQTRVSRARALFQALTPSMVIRCVRSSRVQKLDGVHGGGEMRRGGLTTYPLSYSLSRGNMGVTLPPHQKGPCHPARLILVGLLEARRVVDEWTLPERGEGDVVTPRFWWGAPTTFLAGLLDTSVDAGMRGEERGE